MIKYNSNNINDWNFGDDNIIKVYRNNAVCYYKVNYSGDTPTYDLCYAVVNDISEYTDREFVDVYNKADSKWYKLNNLNQYEQYGIYGSGRTITYYDGKLTVDGDYEYQYSGGSWVNVGEVSGSTATLPDVPFTLNYNAKNYNASTHTIPYTEGALNAIDAVITGTTANIIDHHEDGYIQLTGSTSTAIRALVGTTNFSRSSSNPNITIVCKAYTPGSSSEGSILSNRNESYNWMYRHKSAQLRFHGTSEQGSIAVSNTEPNTCSVRIDSSRLLKYNNWTQNTTSTYSNFNYGSDSNGGALFSGYYSTSNEMWKGVFYWIYMSLNTLTDEQVQQVIAYNEGGGQTEYPVYYDEKSDPLDNLTFNSLEAAEEYAYNNCVYDGMKATINGSKYSFDSENGWVLVPEYYKVEDVTSGGDSGWTITGSGTYNPNSSYYDDFSVETRSTSVSYKIAKVTIFGYDNFTYYLRANNIYNYSYAYVCSTNIDELSSDPTSMNYNDYRVITNTYGRYMSAISPVNLNNYRRVTYNNLDKTVEHTFYVVFYGRTYSNYVGNATILIPKEQDNENWEQVTFSSSTNVSGSTKALYIDGSTSSGGTNYFHNRWIIGLPSGSHSSYVSYSSYDYCPNATSTTFTSVAGEQRQVNFTWNSTTKKTLSFRLTDGNGNVLTPTNTVYYNMTFYNSCGVSNTSSNVTFPRTVNVKVGGRFRFANSSNRHYIYGYSPNISLNYDYYVNNYQSTFDITYTKLSEEAVTITYTTYDPNDSETPAFKTDITWPYSGGTTSSTTLTSFDVPYTYPYEVSQTSNKFSADNQTFTAGQSSRTISFTLYPNNREFSTVADMEAYAYAWEGMKAKVGDTNYEYENGEWVENQYTQYEYISTVGISESRYKFDTGFYPTTANTIEIKMQMTGTSVDWGMVFGWASCDGDSCDNTQYRFTTVTSNYGLIARKGNTSATAYYAIGSNKDITCTIPISSSTWSYTTGGSKTTCNVNVGTFNYPSSTALHLFSLGNSSGKKSFKGKIYYIKVYDGNGNLVKHYVPSDNNGTPCFYEIVDGEYIMDTYTGSNHGTLTLGPIVS